MNDPFKSKSIGSIPVTFVAVYFIVLQATASAAFDEPFPDTGTAAPTAQSSILNDSTVDANQGKSSSNELAVPSRAHRDASGESLKSSQSKSQLMDVGLKLGIVVGVFLIVMILMSKKSDSATIPKEAIEVLGRVPFSGKQALQLVRFGQKLVLVEASTNGLKPISEMTDPLEVQQMLNTISTKRR